MNKLLSAELHRLFKSSIYKVCLACSIVLSIALVAMLGYEVFRYGDVYAKLGRDYQNIDSLLFGIPLYLIYVVGTFTGIFVGTEYADGTLRNKIIVGHFRSHIYLSKLIVCGLASETFIFSALAVIVILGKLFIGGTTLTSAQLFAFFLVTFFAVFAITAILLLIAMSVQNKAVGAVSCVLLVIIMMFGALMILSKLNAPEYIEQPATVITDADTGETEIIYEKERNPHYLTGAKRQLYLTLQDILPYSQLYQFAMKDVTDYGMLLIYDCFTVFFSTGAGILILRKKNVK